LAEHENVVANPCLQDAFRKAVLGELILELRQRTRYQRHQHVFAPTHAVRSGLPHGKCLMRSSHATRGGQPEKAVAAIHWKTIECGGQPVSQRRAVSVWPGGRPRTYQVHARVGLAPSLTDRIGNFFHRHDSPFSVIHPPRAGLHANGEYTRYLKRLQRIKRGLASANAAVNRFLRVALWDRQHSFKQRRLVTGIGDARL
jgi:hypothetical protein